MSVLILASLRVPIYSESDSTVTFMNQADCLSVAEEYRVLLGLDLPECADCVPERWANVRRPEVPAY
jgi:hypothetical protein